MNDASYEDKKKSKYFTRGKEKCVLDDKIWYKAKKKKDIVGNKIFFVFYFQSFSVTGCCLPFESRKYVQLKCGNLPFVQNIYKASAQKRRSSSSYYSDTYK